MIVVLVAIFCGIAGVLLRTGLDGNSDEGEAPPHTVESLAYTHAAPGRGFTVPQAHRAMQQHRTCRREDCPRKRAAYQALVDARRLRPDSGRAY
ncbi:hypothetical protein DFR68_10918 [Nocardia mexicana]|uniref:Uncharacterized protein n=2 Tax=Nocardia mexicana TaxID=279262 RepID=A0A370GYY1_9NOCA|nr:hypothetical protein DFR68_10918 [Nocardia mexicana]